MPDVTSESQTFKIVNLEYAAFVRSNQNVRNWLVETEMALQRFCSLHGLLLRPGEPFEDLRPILPDDDYPATHIQKIRRGFEEEGKHWVILRCPFEVRVPGDRPITEIMDLVEETFPGVFVSIMGCYGPVLNRVAL